MADVADRRSRSDARPVPGISRIKNEASEDLPYAKQRYLDETHRLLRALDDHLASKDYIADDYSIADMPTYPWIFAASGSYIGIDRSAYPNVDALATRIGERPAVQRSYAISVDR